MIAIYARGAALVASAMGLGRTWHKMMKPAFNAKARDNVRTAKERVKNLEHGKDETKPIGELFAEVEAEALERTRNEPEPPPVDYSAGGTEAETCVICEGLGECVCGGDDMMCEFCEGSGDCYECEGLGYHPISPSENESA